MTGQADRKPFDAFKEFLEEAVEALQYEIDKFARAAGAFDDNLSEIDVERAWHNGKECGYLEAVMDLVDFQMCTPPAHCVWPPQAFKPPPTFSSNRKYAAFLLSQAIDHCGKDCDVTPTRMAIRLLNANTEG
jgi:hypothetical protein